jgi:glycosyltransferase involved in cell wall biosynthesis
MTANNRPFIVIAAHDEARHLNPLLKKLAKITKNIIVVDDGSTDSTTRIASRYTKHCLRHKKNLGKGASMRTGADFAFDKLGANYVIFMDGDGQHDPDDLQHFFALLDQKKPPELIFGLRNLKQGMSLGRVLGNRAISFLIWMLFDFYISDSLSGYKAMSKKNYQKLRWQSNNYSVEVEITCRTARNYLPFATVPIKTIYHDTDKKMQLIDGFKIIGKILHLRLTL